MPSPSRLAAWAFALCGCREVIGIEELEPADAGSESCAYHDVVLADAPVAYWQLGELGGTDAVDRMHSTTGTYRGSVMLGVPGAVGCDDTAIELPGTDGYVDMGDVLDFAAVEELSVELWVKPTGASSSYQGLVHKLDAATGDGWEIALPPEGPVFERQGGVIQADEPLAVDVFSHVVAIFDGTTMALYVNGVGKTLASSNDVVDHARALHIGDRIMQDTFLGAIDEVAIYDRALSETEVSGHFDAAR